MTQNGKLLVIGIDAATLDLLEPWMDKGELPSFMKFKKEGVIGHLNSVFPPVTPPAWASFITGKNPGKHGIVDFGVRIENSYDRSYYSLTSSIKSKSFWDYLSEIGKKVGILRIPILYPATKVNGFMISGIFSPRQDYYPPELMGELQSKIVDYGITTKVHYFIEGTEDEFIEDVNYITQKQAEEAIYLLKNKEWDFFMATFFHCDSIQHYFWKYMDQNHPLHDIEKSKKYMNVILDYYKLLDSILKSFYENIDDSVDIIIVSDHGAGPLHKYVYTNTWLNHIGLLNLKQKNNSSLEKLINQKKVDYLVYRLGVAKITRLIPKWLTEKIYWGIPTGRPSILDVDWSRTKAYSLGNYGQLFVNLIGRDPEGTVEPGEEYEKLREEIINELMKLEDPDTGEKLIDSIRKREEVYFGPHADQCADILFTMKGLKYMTRMSYEFSCDNKITSIPLHHGESSWHRFNGTFMAMGPSFKKGMRINPEITDMAPTILHMYGIPIPSDMDGRVLTEIFNERSDLIEGINKNEMTPNISKVNLTDLTKDDETKIKERLKKLGYL